MKIFIAFLFAALAALGTTANDADNNSSFSEITGGIDQSVTDIVLGPKFLIGVCVPVSIFTIEPADTVTVSSSPANLVTVSNDGETMKLEWNDNVTRTVSSSEGRRGVIIGIPAGQLESVSVGNVSSAQIMDGFTAVSSLDVYDYSEMRATFSSLSLSGLSLSVSGASTAYIKSNVNITGGRISDVSYAAVETPEYTKLDVTGTSNLRIVGDIGGGSVSDFSTVTATGSITGSINNSDISTINAGSCGSSVSNSGASSCNSGTQYVTVDTSEQALLWSRGGSCGTFEGTIVWGWDSFIITPRTISPSAAPSALSSGSLTASPITVTRTDPSTLQTVTRGPCTNTEEAFQTKMKKTITCKDFQSLKEKRQKKNCKMKLFLEACPAICNMKCTCKNKKSFKIDGKEHMCKKVNKEGQPKCTDNVNKKKKVSDLCPKKCKTCFDQE